MKYLSCKLINVSLMICVEHWVTGCIKIKAFELNHENHENHEIHEKQCNWMLVINYTIRYMVPRESNVLNAIRDSKWPIRNDWILFDPCVEWFESFWDR